RHHGGGRDPQREPGQALRPRDPPTRGRRAHARAGEPAHGGLMRMRRRSDLPLAKDASSRFIPWIVALMIYLAALALAGALAANSAVERWSRNLLGSLTVEIMPPDDADPKVRHVRVESAVALLLGTPGIAR